MDAEPYPLPAGLPCKRCGDATFDGSGFCDKCKARNLEEARMMEQRGQITPLDQKEYR
jgi:uncharacterized OB-fold protein